MKKASNILKAVIIAIVLITILIFSFQNLDPVTVDFFKMKSKEIPLFIILVGVLVLGVLVGYLIGLISGSKVAENKLNKLNIKANERVAEAEGRVLTLEKKIDTLSPSIPNQK